ncbi:MAG: XdhC family protein, partial [Desulfobacterales bacterium]
MKEIIQAICRLLGQGESIVLATIIRHEGSTPRSTGTKMIVRKDGTIVGTIGGGLLEAEVLGYAKKVFETRQASIYPFDMTHTEAAGMGMVCGGDMDVLVEYLAPDAETIQLFEATEAILLKGQKCILSTDLADLRALPPSPLHCLITEEGKILGNFPHPPRWMDDIRAEIGATRFAALLPIEETTFFLEPFRELGFLILFGAGHVAKQVAISSLNMGFRTLVLDDRPEFASPDHFPESIAVSVLTDFNSCLEGLSIDDDSYLVIVTRGHRHDKVVLSQALKTPAGYIGMIGSTHKRDALYKALLEEGFSQTDLDRV